MKRLNCYVLVLILCIAFPLKAELYRCTHEDNKGKRWTFIHGGKQCTQQGLGEEPTCAGYVKSFKWLKCERISHTIPAKQKVHFGFGLKGGYSLFSLEDFEVAQNSIEHIAELMDYSVIADELPGLLFGGIDLSLEYHNLGLSVGFRYFPGGTFETGLSSADETYSTKLKLSTFAIPVELFYNFPVCKKFSLRLGAGIDYYHYVNQQ